MRQTRQCILNPFYEHAGILSSVWLARQEFDGVPFVFSTGDHYFSLPYFQAFLADQPEAEVLVDIEIKVCDDEDMKVFLNRTGKLRTITKSFLEGTVLGEFSSLVRFSAEGSRQFFDTLEKHVWQHGIQGYVADVLCTLHRKWELAFHLSNDHQRIDIDFPCDLTVARKLYAQHRHASRRPADRRQRASSERSFTGRTVGNSVRPALPESQQAALHARQSVGGLPCAVSRIVTRDPLYSTDRNRNMTRAPVLFRVDAGPRIGWEHLYRCLVLAGALQRRRRPAYFLSQLEPASLGLNIKRAGNDWLEADGPAGTPDDLQETVQEIRRLRPAAVIVDSPEVSQEYLGQLRNTGILVASIDSLANTPFPSRLIINPLLGPDRESYEFETGTQVLLGARYALVRPEMRRIRPIRSQEPVQPFRVLIALGDDDPNNQAGELAKALLNCPKVGRVDVAVRQFHPQLLELQALAATMPDRLEIVSEPSEVSARIVRSHFAISAGNYWSLELACVGVPQLIIVQSEMHWPTAQRLEEEGAATCLGWHANVSALTMRQAVHDLLSDNLERQGMSRCGRKLIDGRGPDRLVTALEVMLHPSRQLQELRAAA